jgi:hypothetical protein
MYRFVAGKRSIISSDSNTHTIVILLYDYHIIFMVFMRTILQSHSIKNAQIMTLKVFLRRNAVINIPNAQVGIVSKFIDEVVHWISFIQNRGLDLH